METFSDQHQQPLELLIPWELPLDQTPSPADRTRINRALSQLLQALVNPSFQKVLADINQALAELGNIDTQIATIQSTKTNLKVWEVEDYDRYFQIRHVCTEHSAICLVRGLLVTCQNFSEICLQIPWLEAHYIQQQRQGFISYALMLKRMFDLDEDKTKLS